MIDAKFMRDHFTLVTVTDTPAPSLDPETLAEILEAMKSAAARLRGVRCEFSDNRAAASLERARLDLIDALNL
jgi:ABC-type polar amino acid transport system ATPase subunit